MHRFFLPPESWSAGTLDKAESHHCLHVLRMGVGDRLTVFDGRGRVAAAVIQSHSSSGVVLEIHDTPLTPAPSCSLTLAQGVLKGKNMDLIIQKSVELGAACVAPLLSERSVVHLPLPEAEKKRGKWRDIALEACKQCGQNFLPRILVPAAPNAFLKQQNPSELLLLASLQPDARPLKVILSEFLTAHGRLPASATVLIGPEGDFSPSEISLAKSHGYMPWTLGPIILRAETAALYSLSVLAHELFSSQE